VDGAISQFGAIDDHHMLQAKGHRFTTTDLLGGHAELAAPFRHGSFANLYLSPRDYHRLHMPCDGKLERMIHVPGTLFSVNPITARGVPNLFARNERVVCLFTSSEHGPFAMVLVGATIVGSIATAWHGVVNGRRSNTLAEWSYDDPPVCLRQGEEMGCRATIRVRKRDIQDENPVCRDRRRAQPVAGPDTPEALFARCL
jgi:phosphatidylserine decarboxylase